MDGDSILHFLRYFNTKLYKLLIIPINFPFFYLVVYSTFLLDTNSFFGNKFSCNAFL